MTVCDLSLREGLVLDYLSRHRQQVAHIDRYPDVRRRSIVELAERCHYSPNHAQQVARLALALFDQTRSAHGLGNREREWLEYAAFLHDVGALISYERHHKHSYYLIKNGDLRGFEPDEIEMIALVARYHRRAEPKGRHDEFADLPAAQRQVVRILSAILRLAESFDRGHSQAVSALELRDRGKHWLLDAVTSADAELELWSARREAGPLERMLTKPLRLSLKQVGPTARKTDRTRGEGEPTASG